MFSLEGCVWRGWLPGLAKIAWQEPAARLPWRERFRAARGRWLARQVFRAEPLLDRWLPARRS